MNKENAVRSKIPIPVDPLPPLSENVLMKQRDGKTVRQPLETIFKGLVNADSNSLLNKRIVEVDTDNGGRNNAKSDIIKIDTRHVTIRQKTEKLICNYEVFNENVQGVFGESSKTASTPAVKFPLEPCGVKNIKRSLKRPHSRELQGISPLSRNENGEEKYKRKLNFSVHLQEKVEWRDLCAESYSASFIKNYGEDLLKYFIMKEERQAVTTLPGSTRACIINWLVKINGRLGNPAAVQTASWYFDTLLANTKVELNNLQVVAAACYWLSTKLHGGHMSAKSLVKTSSNAFSVKVLLATEKAVMRRLNFPPHPTLPQELISYLSCICDASNSEEIEAAATILHMAGFIIYKTYVGLYPSVLAAAAVTNALMLLDKKVLLCKLKMNVIYEEANKNAHALSTMCAVQREALRIMTLPVYKYDALLLQNDPATVEKIVRSAKRLKVSDREILKNM